MSQQVISTNTFTSAKWIVSSDATQGTHTTVAGALSSASSGDTIFIRPGTYTEDITLKAGVNLSAYECDEGYQNKSGNVNIVGTVSASYNGVVNISGIGFTTNSNFLLNVTGSNASNLNFYNCSFYASNNNSITVNAASFVIVFFQCSLYAASTYKIFTITTGAVVCRGCLIASVDATTNTIAAGSVQFFNSTLSTFWTTSSTAILNCYNSKWNDNSLNSTLLTTAGSGINEIFNSSLYSGSASTISIGSGTQVYIANSSCSSSNTNVLTGAGTVNLNEVSYNGSSSGNNVTTKTSFANQMGSLSLLTPLTVANGGSGQSSLTAYEIITAGTTTTGAVQQVTDNAANQVLQSGGGSALPTFTGYPRVSGLGVGASAGSTAGITFDGSNFLTNYVQAGSWTPGISFGGGTTGITYTTQSGSYTRIGNVVFYTFNITLSSKGSSTGIAAVTGFPLNGNSAVGWSNVAYPLLSSLPGTAPTVVLNVGNGVTTAALFGSSSGDTGLSNLTNSNFGNTSQMNGCGFYFTG